MPTLDEAALTKRLQTGRLEPLHVFWGEDVRRLDAAVDAVEATIDPADRPFAVERLYAGDAGAAPVDIAAAARVYPMLGDRRIVIVLRAERFLKPKRAAKPGDDDGPPAAETEGEAPADDVQPLIDYVKEPSPSTVLVFVAADLDRGRRFTKLLLERAHVTAFAGLGGDAPGAWREARVRAQTEIRATMARAGKTLDHAGERLLAERAAGDISRLRGDLERLLLYAGDDVRISAADVADIVSSESGVEDEWAVVNAIGAGDAARALRELGRRFERGDSPHGVVGQLRWWVSTKLAEGDPARVRPAIEALLRTDLALKSSGGDEQMLVERLVIELTGRPLPQRGW
jgi:DNA polymerase-3 subunit delta